MEKKIILIDSDGVLVALDKHWCSVYNKRYDDNLTPEQFTATWDGMADVVKPECGEKVYNLMQEPGFFQGCEPYEGAVDTLQQMSSDPKLDCYIVTAYSGSPEAAKGKVEFYMKHCPFFDPERIVLCKPKFLLVAADVLIDDSSKNLKKFQAERINRFDAPVTTLMIAQQHNQADAEATWVSARVKSLGEAYEYIKAVVLV